MTEGIITPKVEIFYIPRAAAIFDVQEIMSTIIGNPSEAGKTVLTMLMGTPPRACYTHQEADLVIAGWIAEFKKGYNIKFLVPDEQIGRGYKIWKDIKGNNLVWSSVNTLQVAAKPIDLQPSGTIQ